MDYQKALSILGLHPNFTENELKKAHRELANKYHPDRNKSSEAEAKMKDINEARDYLAKYLKDTQPWYNTNTYNNNPFDVILYRNEKYQELYNIANASRFDVIVSGEYTNITMQIYKLLNEFGTEISKLKDKQSIDNKFKEYVEKIKNQYKELEKKFYKNHKINSSNIKEKINYDCTLEEFYQQLLKIKDKYSKEAIIKKKLEEETEKYKTYVGYDKIKELIKIAQNNALIKIRKNGLKYTQKDIDEMHQEILEGFQLYYTLKQKIDELDGITAAIDDNEIKKKYTTLNNEFKRGAALVEIEERIKELETLIDEYIKENQRKIDFKNNEPKINEIYQSLITRYSDALKDYNFLTQSTEVNNLSNFLNKVLKLFKQGIEEKKTLDFFNMFNEITFKSIDDDNKIIEKITENLNPSKSNIYIKTKHNYIFDECSFFYLDEKNMIMHKMFGVISAISSKKITQKDLEQEYIPIENFLYKATFIGENKKDYLGRKCGLIYKMDRYSLFLLNHQFCIEYNKAYIETSDRIYTNLDEFKDKDFLIFQIKEQIKKRIEELEKNNQSSSKSDSSHSYDFGKIFNEEKQYNTDDPYGYNGPKRR